MKLLYLKPDGDVKCRCASRLVINSRYFIWAEMWHKISTTDIEIQILETVVHRYHLTGIKIDQIVGVESVGSCQNTIYIGEYKVTSISKQDMLDGDVFINVRLIKIQDEW